MNAITDFLTRDKYNLILILFGFVFIIQFYYYVIYYARLARDKKKSTEATPVPVSVIICAKNEALNLQKNLPSILEQDYPDYEVIVVNDSSYDDTLNVLIGLKSKYKQLRYTTIEDNEKFGHGKKLAIIIGIKAARHEWMLFTDADCLPASNQWIRQMKDSFVDEKSIVLGYGAYNKGKGLLNNIIRYETFFNAMQYLSLALCGKAYMGVGRNLAYRKSLFYSGKGFTSHLKLLSGDDDLFVNEHARKTNTGIEISPESITYSDAEPTWNLWFRQKRRHLTTAKYYKFSSTFLLTIEPLSRLLFYGLFVVLVVNTIFVEIVLSIFAGRLLFQQIILLLNAKKLNEKGIIIPSLLYDIILPFINIGLYVVNIFSSKRVKW